MTPAGQGRHCAACDKVVVDFTRMTDAEVVAWLQRQSGNSCGQGRADQLERPLLAAVSIPRWRTWLTTAVTVSGISLVLAPNARAQQIEQPKQTALASQVTTEVMEQDSILESSILITGRVIDASTGQGFPGAVVLVYKTNHGVSTNQDGTFNLHIPTPVTPGLKLEFSAIGYLREQRSLSEIQKGFIEVSLSVDPRPLLGVIVVGAHDTSHWYSPRSLWQRLFRH
ncbi:hypothetical protein AM218_13715 [Hymenobacter sp. DG25A]|nr:hypothetical protein AM218_13715 [Hymenobacter sp. DG25A]